MKNWTIVNESIQTREPYSSPDDGTYYNRYTDEQMTAEDAEHWLYGELSSIIHRR